MKKDWSIALYTITSYLHMKTFVVIYENISFFIASSYFLSSSDNLCKQFGLRLELKECPSWSGSKQFDTLILFLKEFFEKQNINEKVSKW